MALVPADKTGHGKVHLRLADRNKTPVTGLKAHVRFHRPVGKDDEETVALRESESGLYTAPVRLPLAGRWYADIDIRRGQTIVYRMRHELMVTP